jgi:hypothetical protein
MSDADWSLGTRLAQALGRELADLREKLFAGVRV